VHGADHTFVVLAAAWAVHGGSNPARRAGTDAPTELHLIEEYARHNGHADLLRERIDGSTGE
jgi:hypothetical protein